MSDLDIEQSDQLLTYLRNTRRIGADETPVMHNLAGGVSNRTVLVERPAGEAWVMKQALARLRVKVDWISDPRRVHLEAKGLRWLEKLAPKGTITPLIFEDHEHHLLAMQAVPKPHDNWKELLLAGDLQTDHIKQFARLLATIHRTTWQQRDTLSREFADAEFFESLRVEPYYLYTASQVPEAAPFIHDLVRATRQRKLTIVHGDYSPKNILIYQNKLILLDHEVIHFGDPGFDLGFSMTHLLSKAHHLPSHRARFAEATLTYWKIYRDTLNDVPWRNELEPIAVRHTMACLLARVAGRSPLEYLADSEKSRQRALIIQLMSQPPLTVADLVATFVTHISR